MGSINLFLTIFFGWILAKNSHLTKLWLWRIFWVQFFLITYETVTQDVIYTQLVSGIISNNIYSFDTEIFSEAGFRAKGLFPGTLIASSFIIYLNAIFRNDFTKLIWIFLMAVMVNGRLALLISVFILLLNIYRTDFKLFGRLISLNVKHLTASLIGIIFIISLVLFMPDTSLNNLLNTFDLTSTANRGRIISYTSAIIGYNNYDMINKLFGAAEYTIYGLYNKPTSPESEILGMLLEIGLIGLLIYFFALYKLYDKKYIFFNNNLIGFNVVIFTMLTSMVIYRHIMGNQRGALFWFLIFSEFYRRRIMRHQ